MSAGLRRVGMGGLRDVGTYKIPRVKTISSIAFCFLGSWSELMTGMGMVKTAKSVTTLTPAMTYQMVALSRQNPLTFGSQKAATGMQTMGRRKERVTAQHVRKHKPTTMIFLRIVLEKMRLYWSRMEILVKQTATL